MKKEVSLAAQIELSGCLIEAHWRATYLIFDSASGVSVGVEKVEIDRLAFFYPPTDFCFRDKSGERMTTSEMNDQIVQKLIRKTLSNYWENLNNV